MSQRLRQFFSFLHEYRSSRRHIMHLLVAFALMGLPALADAQPTCLPDGDVDQGGDVTAADALLVFQYVSSFHQLDTCQQSIADVSPGGINALDALCILQNSPGLPSRLDGPAPGNLRPTVNAGFDRSVAANTMVILSGTASDPDGVIVAYLWEQTAGPVVSLVGADSATAAFTAPDVSTDETLSFQFPGTTSIPDLFEIDRLNFLPAVRRPNVPILLRSDEFAPLNSVLRRNWRNFDACVLRVDAGRQGSLTGYQQTAAIYLDRQETIRAPSHYGREV